MEKSTIKKKKTQGIHYVSYENKSKSFFFYLIFQSYLLPISLSLINIIFYYVFNTLWQLNILQFVLDSYPKSKCPESRNMELQRTSGTSHRSFETLSTQIPKESTKLSTSTTSRLKTLQIRGKSH